MKVYIPKAPAVTCCDGKNITQKVRILILSFRYRGHCTRADSFNTQSMQVAYRAPGPLEYRIKNTDSTLNESFGNVLLEPFNTI